MELLLDRSDLLMKHADIACSATKFEHFLVKVQKAILAVGKAKFETNGGTNYNVIYPPKKQRGVRWTCPACGRGKPRRHQFE